MRAWSSALARYPYCVVRGAAVGEADDVGVVTGADEVAVMGG